MLFKIYIPAKQHINISMVHYIFLLNGIIELEFVAWYISKTSL